MNLRGDYGQTNAKTATEGKRLHLPEFLQARAIPQSLGDLPQGTNGDPADSSPKP
jgi:hypothetical protein